MARAKTGGRKVGTPNKRSLAIEEKLAALGCDPIVGMARIAMDHANPVEVRAAMFRELAQYVAPKRRAIEVSSAEADAEYPCHLVRFFRSVYLRLGSRRRLGPNEGFSPRSAQLVSGFRGSPLIRCFEKAARALRRSKALCQSCWRVSEISIVRLSNSRARQHALLQYFSLTTTRI
jgi:hypothetical protein